jgi:hypothetical protein
VKLTAKVKLEGGDKHALLRTLEAANECADWISEQAWHAKTFAPYSIHKVTYTEARIRTGLTAQVVIRAISKVADSYKLDKKVQRTFRPHGAIAYDPRILRWDIAKRRVSIWTVEGRREFSFVGGERQYALLATQHGESDLIYQRGEFYLAATCDAPEAAPISAAGFLGVDLGIAQIAVDSDGRQYSGSQIKKRSLPPSPPAPEAAKEANPRRETQAEETFGQGATLRPTHEPRYKQGDRCLRRRHAARFETRRPFGY